MKDMEHKKQLTSLNVDQVIDNVIKSDFKPEVIRIISNLKI